MVTKRTILVEIILVLSLLGACIYGFLWMKKQDTSVYSSAFFCVVPPDAIVVQRFKSFEDASETFSSENAMLARFGSSNNGLSRFIHEVCALAQGEDTFSMLSQSEAIFSVHYTGKNNLNVLLGIDFNLFAQGEQAFEGFCTHLGGASLYKRYNKEDIYQLFEGPSTLYFAISNDFLLAGTSPVVVESSIRHLASGRSLMDNQTFESLITLSSKTSESNVYVNVRQFDKLFGSLLGRQMQQYADFVSKIASWISLEGTTSGDFVHLNGYILLDKGVADYFATLNNQSPAQVKLWESVPSTTLAFISFSPSDFVRFLNQYDNFLEVHKRDKRMASLVSAWENKMQTNLSEWFLSLHPVEAALAWLPAQGDCQWITLVRSNQIQQARMVLGFPASDPKQLPQVLPNPAAGAFSALLGPFFSKSTESHFTIMENTLLFGDKELLESFVEGYVKSSSLYAVMREGRIRGKWMEESGITCVLQSGEARDSIVKMWDSRYSPMIEEALSLYDYSLAIFQVTSIGSRPYTNFLLASDNHKQAGASARKPSNDAVDNEPLPMNIAVFKIFNHASRKNETIEQMPDKTLVLKDIYGKEVWRTRTKYAIVDQVAQIDFYKNDKLQMLYVSEGKELCLLDILGRMVTKFPVVLSIPVRKGPFVFDRQRNREYEIFLIHTDNSLRLYDKTGTEMKDFKPFIPEDRIEQCPVLVTHGGEHYWLVYGAQKDYLLKPDGSIAIVLQRRNRLDQNTNVMIDENGVLQGITTEGRILSVQLSSGTIKTRKP